MPKPSFILSSATVNTRASGASARLVVFPLLCSPVSSVSSPGYRMIDVLKVTPVISNEPSGMRARPAGLYQSAAPVVTLATTAPPVSVTSTPAFTSSLLPAAAVLERSSTASAIAVDTRRMARV